MHRRNLLKCGLAAAVATPVAPALASVAAAQRIPRLIGDGIHDDSDGLEALINWYPVSVEVKGAFYFSDDSHRMLTKARLRTTRTVTLNGAEGKEAMLGYTIIDAPSSMGPWLYVPSGGAGRLELNNITVIRGEAHDFLGRGLIRFDSRLSP